MNETYALCYTWSGKCFGTRQGKVYLRCKWPIRPALISGFCSMKRLGVFFLPPGWGATSSQSYPPASSSPVSTCTPECMERLVNVMTLLWPFNQWEFSVSRETGNSRFSKMSTILLFFSVPTPYPVKSSVLGLCPVLSQFYQRVRRSNKNARK